MSLFTLHNLTNSTGIIAFKGQDAASFLQGQTTCDVLAIEQANSTLGALCNPKGRAISSFHLLNTGDAYLMFLPQEMTALVIKRLSMFVFRSKVDIQDASEQFNCFARSTTIPSTLQATLSACSRIPIIETQNLEILVCSSQQAQVIQANDAIHINHQQQDWQHLLTAAYYPEITLATTELFIPQMLNLDLLNAISFQKGCYTGQEIIARMHYKGSVKRRLVSYKSNKQHLPADEIHQLNIDNSIGTIISSLATEGSQYLGLAVLKVGTPYDTPIILSDNSELMIQLAEYDLD